MSDFYIGYLPQAPPDLARRVRRVVAALALGAAALALLLIGAQGRFDASSFEFQQYRDFEGVVEARPYPTLLVARPGDAAGQPYSRYLLVAHGKHGADADFAGLDGKQVRLRGEVIYRDGHTMIQIQPGSVSILPAAAPAASAPEQDLGERTVTGEIVDTKCYLGVMNPGHGKVHRDCEIGRAHV